MMKEGKVYRFRKFISDLLNRWQPSEAVVLLGSGLVLGVAGGAGVWLFKKLIDGAHILFFNWFGGSAGSLGGWTIALVPILGGLVVGLIAHFFIGEERHHGVAGIMEAAALAGGRLRYRRIPAKAAASALSIGSGASVGPEDPSVQIGANIGSMFGQLLQLSDERVRTLVAAGAASGIAAAFNAPIAGVFFALEIILGEISGGAFGTVVLSSVISAVFTQAVSGPEPAFHVPAYALGSPIELPLYLGLGLLAGPVSAFYIYTLYFAQDAFHQLKIQKWLKPAIAGLAVGVVGIFLPQIFGVGYETIGGILNGNTPQFWLLLVLLVAKLVLTSISIGGGFLGGVFAPSLFIGAALGGAYGLGISMLFPSLNILPGAFAMVGMAAVLAGSVRAPLTAVLLLFEMTNDYRIILPLMAAVVLSMFLSEILIKDSVYTLGLARKGIRLERGRDVDVLEIIDVADVMQPVPMPLAETESAAHAAEILQRTNRHGLPVVNEQGDLVGMLTLQDLARSEDKSSSPLTVGDICTRDLLVAYPEESIGAVLRRMGPRDIGRMPVVSRSAPNQLIGWLRRSDVLRAYDTALNKRAVQRHRIHQVRLGAVSGENVHILELPIHQGSVCDGKRVKDIPWPENCLVVSLRKGMRVSIPHGTTRINSGDILVVVTEKGVDPQVERLCAAEELESTPQ